tara:strand:+ start:65 stop:919 length:855 start_codon:yes stop_codon:yes gene_type:complete
MKITKSQLKRLIIEWRDVVTPNPDWQNTFWPGGTEKPFHPPVKPMKVTRYPNSGHDGIDYGVSEGSEYYAVYDGYVDKVVGGVDDEWSQNYRWYFKRKYGAGENNIVYQAFPSLRLHVGIQKNPEGYNLISGPIGLEKFWDVKSKKFTGTEEDVIAIVNSAPSIKNKNDYIKAAQSTGQRNIGGKYGHSGLEHAKGGNSITLTFDDPDGGETTLYCAHMESVHVREGESVSRGQVLGYVGRSGRITGPHVHLSIKKYQGQSGVSSSKSIAKDFENRIYKEVSSI